MILVGGGVVNFHGYQRHTADVDFWIDTHIDNMDKLIRVFKDMGYDIDEFPQAAINKMQIMSLKFSPYDLDLDLITRFYAGKSFEEAYLESEEDQIKANKL